MSAETLLRVLRVLRALLLLATGVALWPAGASAATYSYAAEPFAWINPSGSSEAAWSRATACSGGGTDTDDDVTAELPIGFSFTYGTTTYTTVRIQSNGRLQFNNTFCGYGTASTSPVTYPYNYPDGNVVRTMRIYGNDLDSSSGGGKVYYRTIGTAPNRRFVVTWQNVREWNMSTSNFTFQIILEEGGDFVYQFGATSNPSGGKAQIGWELTTSDYGLVTFTNIGSLASTALRFTNASAVPAPGGFNAFDTSTSAGSVSGAIQTRIAAQSFSVAVVALNAARTAVHTGFVGSVTVDLLNSVDNSGTLNATTGCRTSWSVIQSLGSKAFVAADAGRVTVSGIVEANAWRDARFRITYTPPTGSAVVGCSSDNFAIRPNAFGVPVATDATWQTSGTARTLANTGASGGIVHAAGRPFQVSFAALNAAGATTTGYNGAPSLVFDSCVLPATCSGASAASLIAAFAVSGGVATAAAATYSEVGSFSAHAQDSSFAAVDASDGTPAAQRLISSATTNIGRFVPDRYLLTLANTPSLAPGQDTACTTRGDWNFTWIGQPFAWATPPTVTVTAQNAGGTTTTQWSGSLAKLVGSSIVLAWGSNAPASAPFSASGQTVAVAATGAGLASATFGAATVFAFARPATPVAPFNAVISLTVDVSDTSESATTGNGTIGSVAALVINGGGAGIDFTGTNAAGANAQLYGRLQVGSAHGDSRRPLAIPYEAQAWSGAAWYRNHRDSCTAPSAGTVAMSNWGSGLSACDVSVTAVTTASRGQGWIQLSAPTAARTGGVDVALRLGAASGSVCVGGAASASASAGRSWLQGPWTSAPNYTSDPAGRASFGRLRVDSLIRREVF